MTERSTKQLILQIGIVVGYLGTVLVNALANILPINGLNTGELSDAIPNLFVPAGLTFSIWGLIYLLLAGFTLYSIWDWFSKKDLDRSHISQIGPAFIISSVANIIWILLWHYQLVEWSLAAMVVILATLLYSHIALYKKGGEKPTAQRRWLVKTPISIYLGWITVATVANVTAVAVVSNWDGFGISESAWTMIMVGIAGLITLAMLFTKRDVPYALVVIWAFAGIIIKRLDPALTPETGIVVVTAVMIGLIAIASVWAVIKDIKATRQ